MKMQKLMGALILILMLGATPVTAQNMSDSQVLEYVKEGIRQGKEQAAGLRTGPQGCNQGAGPACEAALWAAEQRERFQRHRYGYQRIPPSWRDEGEHLGYVGGPP